MRLIDADALYDTFERTPWMDNADRDIAEELVDNAPTVNPWVKTSDRLPTEADADTRHNVLARGLDGRTVMAYYRHVVDYPKLYVLWMPIPPLPEVHHDIGKALGYGMQAG